MARLNAFAFGVADYTYDLGISISEDGRELIYPRSRLAVASRAADANRLPEQSGTGPGNKRIPWVRYNFNRRF